MDELFRIAEKLLFPAADQIDAAPVVPRRYLDEMAAAGLYDLPGDPLAAARTVEVLGGASLVTAFLWIQHHSPVRAVGRGGRRPLGGGRLDGGPADAGGDVPAGVRPDAGDSRRAGRRVRGMSAAGAIE